MIASWILYPVLGTVLYYLGCRATITRGLWELAPDPVYAFLICPACSGTWYCAVVALIGATQGVEFLGVSGPVTVILAALWGSFWVPLLAYLHITAMEKLAGVVDDDGQR